MADTTRLAKALIEFGLDNTEFRAAIRDTAQQLAGLTKNFRDTGGDLDVMVTGMSAAGKEASASGKMIAGMSQVGREELARLTTVAEQPASSFRGMLTLLGPMQAAIAGAFTVTAIAGFVKGIGDFAGHMVDLSDETHISTSRLQAWNIIVTQAGLSVDDFTMSVTQLQKRLGDENDGAAAKLREMGLDVEALIAMAPDDAFIKIAEAVSKIGNQSERTAIMFELFGRSGTKMLRLVNDDLAKTVDEVEHSGGIINDNLIRTADRFGDAWDKGWILFRAGAVTAIDAVIRSWSAFNADNSNLPKLPGAPNLGPSSAGLTPVLGPSREELQALDDQAEKIKANVAAYTEHQHKLAELREELSGARATAEIRDLAAAFEGLTPKERANEQTIKDVLEQYVKLEARVGLGVVPVLDQLFQAHGLVTEKGRAWSQQLMTTVVDVKTLESATGDLIPPILDTNSAIDMSTQQLAQVSYAYAGAAKVQGDFTVSTTSAWTEVDSMARSFEQLANISGPTMGAVTQGIGSVTGALSTAHTAWGSFTNGFKAFTKDGGGLTDILGGLSGIVGGIGGIVAAASAAVQGIKALINAFKSDETKYVNKPRDQFFAQFGNDKDSQYQNLANALTEAAGSGDIANQLITALYDADNADKFKAAQQAIVDVFSRAGRDVQMFAAGGIATRPTFGVFGEAGPEAVIPLDRLGAMVGGTRESIQNITLTLDGRVLARSVVRGMPRELHLAGVG
jgi:hypothetical protein